jgi:hypothetical protein
MCRARRRSTRNGPRRLAPRARWQPRGFVRISFAVASSWTERHRVGVQRSREADLSGTVDCSHERAIRSWCQFGGLLHCARRRVQRRAGGEGDGTRASAEGDPVDPLRIKGAAEMIEGADSATAAGAGCQAPAMARAARETFEGGDSLDPGTKGVAALSQSIERVEVQRGGIQVSLTSPFPTDEQRDPTTAPVTGETRLPPPSPVAAKIAVAIFSPPAPEGSRAARYSRRAILGFPAPLSPLVCNPQMC